MLCTCMKKKIPSLEQEKRYLGYDCEDSIPSSGKTKTMGGLHLSPPTYSKMLIWPSGILSDLESQYGG